ncbi:serine/threonine-protein kinase tousled-like 2 isoform X3 [Ixodes scapularis]
MAAASVGSLFLRLPGRWELETMDNIHSLDPRKQELLEARFLGNRQLCNNLGQGPYLSQAAVSSQSSSGGVGGGGGGGGAVAASPVGTVAPVTSLGLGSVPTSQLLAHVSSSGSSNNTNHNQDSNMSNASLGSQHSDKELDQTPEKHHRTPPQTERKRKRKEELVPAAVKGARGGENPKKMNEYFKNQGHSPSRFGGARSPVPQGYCLTGRKAKEHTFGRRTAASETWAPAGEDLLVWPRRSRTDHPIRRTLGQRDPASSLDSPSGAAAVQGPRGGSAAMHSGRQTLFLQNGAAVVVPGRGACLPSLAADKKASVVVVAAREHPLPPPPPKQLLRRAAAIETGYRSPSTGCWPLVVGTRGRQATALRVGS